MAKPIHLELSYPNFVSGQTADPEQFDQNNTEITQKINEVIDYVEQVSNNFTAGIIPDGSITTAKLSFDPVQVKVANAVNADTVSNFSVANLDSRFFIKNALINGNFDVWQRSVSSSLTGTNNRSGYVADRWWCQISNGNGADIGSANLAVSRQPHVPGQTDVPFNPSYFHRLSLSNPSDLGTSGGLIRMMQSIEGVQNFSGQTVTLSFFAKADSPRTIGILVNQVFGTGGSATTMVTNQKINITNLWQEYSVTFAVPSIAGKTIGSANDCLQIQLIYFKQDNTQILYPDGAFGIWGNMTFDLSYVRIHQGNVPLKLFPRSFAEELQFCQRYYEKSFVYSVTPANGLNDGNDIGVAFNVNSDYSNSVILFKVKKRNSPTVTLFSSYNGESAGKWTVRSAGGAYSLGGNTYAQNSNENQFTLTINKVGGFTQGVGWHVGHWVADADF